MKSKLVLLNPISGLYKAWPLDDSRDTREVKDPFSRIAMVYTPDLVGRFNLKGYEVVWRLKDDKLK